MSPPKRTLCGIRIRLHTLVVITCEYCSLLDYHLVVKGWLCSQLWLYWPSMHMTEVAAKLAGKDLITVLVFAGT